MSSILDALHYVTGTHTVKAGLYIFYGWDDNTIGGIANPPIGKTFFDLSRGSVETGFPNQIGISITQYMSPRLIDSRSFDIGYYVQDSWVVNRATINAGVRLDTVRAWTPAVDLPATFFTPRDRFRQGRQPAELEGHLPTRRYRLRPDWRCEDGDQGIVWPVLGVFVGLDREAGRRCGRAVHKRGPEVSRAEQK